MTSRQMLTVMGISGFLYVVLAALASHALVPLLTPLQMNWLQTGLLLHIVHTLVIGIVAVLELIYPNIFLRISGLCFTLGILCFCGSLYVLSLTSWPVFPLITPLGGIIFMLGWLSLLTAALKMSVQKKEKELSGA